MHLPDFNSILHPTGRKEKMENALEKKPLKIYFAGDLFDAKDLGGNLLLAHAIEKCSGGRYKVMLPQDGESEISERSAESIRDADFELLFECDLILANFDGTDLDSGTVVEFCYAKMTDMPALLLRTDFRDSGDRTLPDGDPWNLMCSCYPRTSVLALNAMLFYHQCKASGKENLAERFYDALASEILRGLDQVVTMEPWLEKEKIFSQLSTVVKSIGGTLPERFGSAKLHALADAKARSGLY